CEPTMDVTMFFPDKPWTWRLAEGWGLRGLTFERTPGGNVPIYVIIPLYIPISLSLVPAIILWRRDQRRIRPGHCRCGYDLTGNVSGACPECGTGCKAAG